MKAVVAWIKRQWFWIKWVLTGAAIAIGYTVVSHRLAKRVKAVRRPVTWRPLTDNSVAAMNPNLDLFETVALPDGVTVKDIISVGITEAGNYEVQATHAATDRHGDPDVGMDSGLGL